MTSFLKQIHENSEQMVTELLTRESPDKQKLLGLAIENQRLSIGVHALNKETVTLPGKPTPKGFLTYGILRAMRHVSGSCPVCGGALMRNLDDAFGLWAYLIPRNPMNMATYGREVIEHECNGMLVCSQICGEVVVLDDECTPDLIEKIASEIRVDIRMSQGFYDTEDEQLSVCSALSLQ